MSNHIKFDVKSIVLVTLVNFNYLHINILRFPLNHCSLQGSTGYFQCLTLTQIPNFSFIHFFVHRLFRRCPQAFVVPSQPNIVIRSRREPEIKSIQYSAVRLFAFPPGANSTSADILNTVGKQNESQRE